MREPGMIATLKADLTQRSPAGGQHLLLHPGRLWPRWQTL